MRKKKICSGQWRLALPRCVEKALNSRSDHFGRVVPVPGPRGGLRRGRKETREG